MNTGHNSNGYFDGSTAARAVPPTHVPDLCEQSGCSLESTAEQVCAAINAYVNDVRGFTEKMLWIILDARHPIYPGCCPGHQGLVVDLEMAGLLVDVE